MVMLDTRWLVDRGSEPRPRQHSTSTERQSTMRANGPLNSKKRNTKKIDPQRRIGHVEEEGKRRSATSCVLALALLILLLLPGVALANDPDLDDFFYAIGTVESGHDDEAIGDGGASIGRYQIQRAYWQDAIEFDERLGGEYKDVTDPVYARKVMMAYFRRYAREALGSGDWQTLARIHNGGPRGHKKKATLTYWRKVQKELNK